MLTMSPNPYDDPTLPTQMAPHDAHMAATLTAPIMPAPLAAPADQGGGAPPSAGEQAPPKMSASSSKSSLLDPIEKKLMGRYTQDLDKDARPWGFAGAPPSAEHPEGLAPNHPGFLGHLLHGLSVATGGPNRRQFEEQGLQNDLRGLSKQESEENLQGAEAGKAIADTGKTNAETPEVAPNAASTRALQGAETGKTQAETRDLNINAAMGPSLLNAYAHRVNQVIQAGGDPSTDAPAQQLADAITALQKQPAESPKTTDIKLPNGTIHTMGFNPKSGKYDVDEGLSGFRPSVVNTGEKEQFAEQERGRGLLDKAEQQYRTAQQGAEVMRNMVASAEAGNKMSAQEIPLEGALEITTAQGVHRINRTEVDQFAGGGSLYDRVAGYLGKQTEGQPIDREILEDIRRLTSLQEKAAYSAYKGAYDSATKRYGLKDEEPLKEPGGGQAEMMRARDPQGKLHEAPKGTPLPKGWTPE